MASLPQLSVPVFRLLADKSACCVQSRSETGDIELLTPSDQVSCKIGYDRVSGAALFRLYVPMALRTSPNNRKTPFYIFIDPLHVSQLQSLSLDGSEATQACVASLASSGQCSSTDVIALQFLLKQPPTVVGPPGTTSLEQLSATGRLLESLRSIPLATNLTLYLPKNKIVAECIDDVCAGAQNGSLRPPPRVYGLGELYNNAGGVNINAVLRGESRLPPAYPDIASTSIAQPDARPTQRALGKRRRTGENQEESVPNKAWMQRIEQQLSDLGTRVDEVHQEIERSRSVAPAELSYTRPVTRSVSAHPEATALIELQRVLHQMLPRVSALEQHHQETVPRLSALEQHQEELQQQQQELQRQPQQQQQNTADETSSSTTRDVQVAQSSPAQPIEQQQQQNPQTSPRVPETLPNSSQQIASPQPPWSQLFDRRSDDDDRLAALRQAAGQSQQMTQHSADSDELREATLAHGNDSPQLFAELVALLGEARTLAGRNAHKRPHLRVKLEELGRFAHAANVAAFDASRAWCRALLYFHSPAAADDDHQQLDPRRLLADVADLVGWASERRRACDVSVPPVLEDFVGLGAAAARAAAAAADAEPARAALLAEYERLRDVCVARVLTQSGNRRR